MFTVSALLITLLGATAGYAGAQDVTTWHYNAARTGVQPLETALTPANVNSAAFGKTFSLPVLGDVYAQPLYLKQITMSDGKLHNVLIVATQEDYVYAFDADGNNPASGYLWRQLLLGAGETWLSSNDVGTTDITPNIGITGTPVIDRNGGTIYVVAKSKTTSGTVTFYQRLHALNIADGTEKLSGPTNIQATVSGLGDGGTTVTFNALRQNQRPGLLLAPTPQVGSGNSVVIGWSSHGDNGVYHGWIIAYDAANIAKQTGAWADTPNGSQGGIWMSGGAPALDSNNSIYAADGNGSFDVNTGGKDYGDSAFRLTLTTAGLAPVDYFTPADQSSLDGSDNDMGTSAVLVLPTQAGATPDLMVTADKSGSIYLLNRDKMGGFTMPNNSSLQSFSDGGYSVHSSFAFFNNNLYEAGDGGPLQVWAFNPQSDLFNTAAQSRSSASYGCNGCDGGGSTPSISANGISNGIVWALDNSGYGNTAAVLHAYDPGNLANEFYNSTQAASSRDAAAVGVKFTTPTIANGRVYVGGRNAITVYGLLNTSAPLTATPSFSPNGGTYTAPQMLTIASSTPNASIYYTTNGTAATTGSTLYTGPISVGASQTIHAIAIAPNYAESATASATFTINQVVAVPVFNPAAGIYASSQSVTIADASSGATIYYTANGTTPTASSTRYTGAIAISKTTTLKAIAVAGGASSGVATSPYIIGSAAQTQVSLASSANATGILTDGTTNNGAGIDGYGNGYSASLLGSAITYAGVTYSLGAPGVNDVIRATNAPTIALPPGHYVSLNILGTAVNGNQASQPFTITYSDGSTAKITGNVSDWYTPQGYPGEATAVATAYRDTSSGGRDSHTFNLYEYTIPLDSSKTVKSFTLPNNANVVIVAVTLVRIQTPVPLGTAVNDVGIYTDGTSFSSGGIDGGTSAYSANLLGAGVTYQGFTYGFGSANQQNVVKGINAPVISLVPGMYATLTLLGTAVNGTQASQRFTVTYSDGSASVFTQSMSDWYTPQSYPGEATAVVTAYRDLSNGSRDNRTFNLYQYTFNLNTAKTVRSLVLPNNANVAVLAVTLSSAK